MGGSHRWRDRTQSQRGDLRPSAAQCVVVLEAAEDAQGTEKIKHVKVKPLRKGKTTAIGAARESEVLRRA